MPGKNLEKMTLPPLKNIALTPVRDGGVISHLHTSKDKDCH